MDNDTLKARSIELAERANRLRDKSNDTQIRDKFDKTADILIQLSEPNRFYLAQSVLESDTAWSEEMRSLAHELNVADQTIKNSQPISFEAAMQALEKWDQTYLSSTNPEIMKIGSEIDGALSLLFANDPASDIKESLDYLITFIETVASHIQTKSSDDKDNPTVIVLRNMRDAILVKRELSIDMSELVKENENENINTNSVELARESLNEIYATIKPPAETAV